MEASVLVDKRMTSIGGSLSMVRVNQVEILMDSNNHSGRKTCRFRSRRGRHGHNGPLEVKQCSACICSGEHLTLADAPCLGVGVSKKL